MQEVVERSLSSGFKAGWIVDLADYGLDINN